MTAAAVGPAVGAGGRRRVLMAGACAFFLWHMVATAAQQIPRDSALYPASRLFVRYQELTGLWQGWDMFVTVPYFHAYSIDVLTTEPGGGLDRAGVGLPGLRRYGGYVRTETFFARILYQPEYRGYLEGYARQMCGALRQELGHGGQKFVVHESVERMRYVDQIRADGVIANHEDHSSEVFSCPE